MLQLFGEICWFLVPAGFANMAPIFAAKLFPSWKTPVDYGYPVNDVRLFGDHKTIRGLVSGTLIGGITFFSSSAFDAELCSGIPDSRL
jgi:hypothetical protein